MNRTERLYALVEELRAAAPRQRTVRVLAERLEVSERTVQRDLRAWGAPGLRVGPCPGGGGGGAIARPLPLPPIRFTAEEASALAIAMAAAPDTGAARSALQKIAASLSGPAGDAARAIAGR